MKYGKAYYLREADTGREITTSNGFILCVDENGNGEPVFDLRKEEARNLAFLYSKLQYQGCDKKIKRGRH